MVRTYSATSSVSAATASAAWSSCGPPATRSQNQPYTPVMATTRATRSPSRPPLTPAAVPRTRWTKIARKATIRSRPTRSSLGARVTPQRYSRPGPELNRAARGSPRPDSRSEGTSVLPFAPGGCVLDCQLGARILRNRKRIGGADRAALRRPLDQPQPGPEGSRPGCTGDRGPHPAHFVAAGVDPQPDAGSGPTERRHRDPEYCDPRRRDNCLHPPARASTRAGRDP